MRSRHTTGTVKRRARRKAGAGAAQRSTFRERLQRLTGMLILVIAVGAVIFALTQQAPATLSRLSWSEGTAQDSADANINFARHIGIISGHKGNDSGAVCRDGLTEAQVNLKHALRVADLLRAQGYTVDVLDEFDSRLEGYRAAALVSIHADSCEYINDQASGFKLSAGRAPASQRLAACLTDAYRQHTNLRFHAGSITRDMLNYHAFRKINSQTPAVIIETGFLYLDRALLTQHAERVAQGITSGILCFTQSPEAPTQGD